MPRQRNAFTLTYDLRDRGDEPLYEFIYRSIRDDIARGSIAAGVKLPSKRNLAQHLQVGVATIAAAYDQLCVEGFIEARERSGYYVEDVSKYRCKPVKHQLNAVTSPEKANSGTEEQPEEIAQEETIAAQAARTIEQASDEDFFVDMKANRASVSLFPSSVWARYMREALSFPAESLLTSVPFNGLPELRQAIANYLSRARGMHVSPDCVIIGAGSEYLYGRLLQMFGPKTRVAMENPGYKKFAAISRSFDNPCSSIPIDEEGINVSALEASGAQVAHVSPANHFPTGIVMPIRRRIELFEWANRKPGRCIVEDDYDSEFRYTGRPIMPLYADDAAGKVIYLNAFSKTMVPALRISYLVLPPDLLKRYVETMSFYSCTVSSIEQYALARFIDEGHFERHINRMRTFYRQQRAAVMSAIEASPLAARSRIEERNAGTHFLLRLETDLSEAQIRERARKQGLNVSFLSDYLLEQKGLESKQTANTLVINYAGITPDRVEETVKRLSAAII